MADVKFLGYSVTTHTSSIIHNDEYVHTKISDVVKVALGRSHLCTIGIQKITLRPELKAVYKSVRQIKQEVRAKMR